MRQIIDKREQEILKKLTDLKREGNLKELQFARLLRKQLDTIALSWKTDEKCRHNLAIFSEVSEPDNDQWNEILKKYFEIVDFVYLLEELEENNMLKKQTVSLSAEDSLCRNNILYDREKFRYDEYSSTFWLIGENNKRLYCISPSICKVYNDFAKILAKYANTIIYPLPALDEFVLFNFKSLEQRTFEDSFENNQRNQEFNRKSLSQTNKSLKQTRISICISVFALLISGISEIVQLCSDNVSGSDVKRLEEAIKELKREPLEYELTIRFDTLCNVKK